MYKTLNQLYQRMTTSSAGTALLNMTYTYNAGKNNGQIASSTDAVTGETVAYQYDSLKRLVNAASTSLAPGNATLWSDAYTYDGFGNLTGMTGSGAPSLTVGVNPLTNQITPTNILYDGNGNVTQFGPSGTLTTLGYEVANRVQTVNSTSAAYAYDSANRRVYYRAGTETLYFYGPNGKKLATYTVALTGSQVNFTFQSRNVYFGRQLISAEGNGVSRDKLGSVRWNASTGGRTYFPYGVEYYGDSNTTTNNTEKYATYTRDTVSGLDYAMNRYYNSPWGRFMTPDRYAASAHLGIPQSWDRYAYTVDDPINGNDPSGNDEVVFDDDGTLVGYCDDDWNCIYYGGITEVSVYPDPDPDPTPIPPDPPVPPPPPPTDPPPPPPPAPPPAPSFFELEEISACVYPQGIGPTALTGTLTLDVTYQLLLNNQSIFGNNTLNNLGASVLESVTVTSGKAIYGNGQWCPAGNSLCGTPGTMNPSGQFTDVLARTPLDRARRPRSSLYTKRRPLRFTGD